VLILVILFWIWLLSGGPAGLGRFVESPKALVLALYAGAVVVPVSILAGLTAGIIMLADWPRRGVGVAGAGRVLNFARLIVLVRDSGCRRQANAAADARFAKPRRDRKAASGPAEIRAGPRIGFPAPPPRPPASPARIPAPPARIPAPPARIPSPPTLVPAPPACPPGIGTAGSAALQDGSITS
jgi:hypothetical protein